MDECGVSSAGGDHLWGASFKRLAWAQSRDSWQAPESEEQSPETMLPTPTMVDKPAETAPIPNKIANWLRDCRTPLGASLDDQSSSPSKGPPRNGCSFEDDLSLGAEAPISNTNEGIWPTEVKINANHLQNSSTKPDDPGYSMPAKEKRSQFKQKARSMNSTGSGKSSGTVSSVSELLDLYEEDPEEILYNLGFGREEPDIASKIPPRFFNSSSGAKGIDIKVYLAAQMQRMELENPNYALTSRFRQTEVLATVANVFSDLYSQVSGRPLQRIGTREAEPKEPIPLKNNSSAINAVKKLKRNITKPNLLSSTALANIVSESNGVEGGNPEPHLDQKSKPAQKDFRRRDSSLPLETVTEESLQGGLNGSEGKSALANGDSSGELTDVLNAPVQVSINKVFDQNDGQPAVDLKVNGEQHKTDRDGCSLLHNPHIALHLVTKPQNSFELEELQSNEDEAVPGTRCISRAGSEHLLRTASQQSDSSGFAEDPSTDGSAYLKVQESSDSCDSETTVTSHAGGVSTPVALDHPAFERLQGEEELLAPSSRNHLGVASGKEKITENAAHQVSTHQITDRTRQETEGVPAESEIETLSDKLIADSSSTESGTTVESVDLESLPDSASTPNVGAVVDTTPDGAVDSTANPDSNAEVPASSSSDPTLQSEPTQKQVSSPGLQSNDNILSSSERVRRALLRAEQRSSSLCDDQADWGRTWSKELPRDQEKRTRNPMIRSSSLPTSFPSPTRVVSSMRIQLGGGGSVRHCTPPCYSYKFEEERDEADSIAEEDEFPEEAPSRCRSTLLVHQTSTEGESLGFPEAPPYPLNMNPSLTRSASSLYSVPTDWPMRRLAEGSVWSTNSVPDLTQHAAPHSSLLRQNRHHLPHYRGGTSSPHHNMNIPYTHSQSGQYSQPQQSPYSHLTHTLPHGVSFPQPNMPYVHPHGPYGPPSSFHPPYSSQPPQSIPYAPSTINMQGTHYSPYAPHPHSHSAPNSLSYGYPPYHTHMPYGHQYNPLFTPPAAPFHCETPTPPPAMGSTEMQLRRVLHEIRGTVQSLGQNPSVQRDGTPLGTESPHQAMQPLYEELQMRRRNLNVFRTQMMDLELALMRQQSVVYQHFSSDERREAEQLQRLRSAVRQELQELELQLEDRLLTFSDQLRSAQHSRLCRHPLGLSRGQSIDSLSSSSALRAMEPVSDLLQEQLYLQSELGYDGSFSVSDTPVSGRSSRAESPLRSSRTPDHYSPSPSPQRGGTYRSTVSITPTVPPRPGVALHQPSAESQDQTLTSNLPELSCQREAGSVSPQRSTTGADAQQEARGGGGDTQLQHLIQEIKQSLADEIREEIVNKLLAAVSSRNSPIPGRQTPA